MTVQSNELVSEPIPASGKMHSEAQCVCSSAEKRMTQKLPVWEPNYFRFFGGSAARSRWVISLHLARGGAACTQSAFLRGEIPLPFFRFFCLRQNEGVRAAPSLPIFSRSMSGFGFLVRHNSRGHEWLKKGKKKRRRRVKNRTQQGKEGPKWQA